MFSRAETLSRYEASRGGDLLQGVEVSYQKLFDQVAAPPDRIQSQEEQRSRRKGEQKQTGFREEKHEITDRNPAESPPQWESLRQGEAKPEESQ